MVLNKTTNSRLYASCVRSWINYGSETTPFLDDVGLKFEIVEIQMIRWICSISLNDRTSDELRKIGRSSVEPITTVIRNGRL